MKNTKNRNGLGQNLALLSEFYALLSDVLSAYFSPPVVPDADRLQRVYSRLFVAIESLLAKPGLGYLRQDCFLPFPTLYSLNEGAFEEWEETIRRRVIESLATIEQRYYAAGSPGLPGDDEVSDLIDEVRKTLKKYRKAQKKAQKKSGASFLPDTPAPVQTPAGASEFTLAVVHKRQEQGIYEEKRQRKKTVWKTIIIGIIIGIITGTVARLIVYFITRYLEGG